VTPPSATAATNGHARTVRRGASPRGPRRVSGPARTPAGRSARAAAPTRKPAVTRAATNQLNLLGGAVALPRPQRARPARSESLGPRLLRWLGALSESRWLDRLLTGRTWIALVAAGLIGLVFMQVSLLKLNASMGSAVERSAVLERENAVYRAKVSQLESNDRIQQKAAELSLVLPPAGEVRFLGPNGKRVGGDAPVVPPSEAAATTALLPTLPAESSEQGTAPVADPAAEPATISTAPAPAATAAPAPTTPTPTAPPTTVAPTAPAPAPAPAQSAAATAPAASTGGAAPTGLDGQ
jgi:hypothetical protein